VKPQRRALQEPKNLTRWLAYSLVLSLLANPWCGHPSPELAAAGPALLVLVNLVLPLALLMRLVVLVRLVVQAVLVAKAMALPARLQPSAARRGTAAGG